MAALQQVAANIFRNFLPDNHAWHRHQSDRLSKILKTMEVVVICEVPVEEAAVGVVERGVPVGEAAAEDVESRWRRQQQLDLI